MTNVPPQQPAPPPGPQGPAGGWSPPSAPQPWPTQAPGRTGAEPRPSPSVQGTRGSAAAHFWMAVSAVLLIATLVVSLLWLRDQQRAERESRAALLSRMIAQYAGQLGLGSGGLEDETKAEVLARACDDAPDYAVEAFEDIIGKDCTDASFSGEIIKAPYDLPECQGHLCDFQFFSGRLFAVTIE